ncbi:RidA family protein [Tistrella mobilis]|uniref:RidA family protein n=1 Tax=Tistrella mobilis TaxID=171437 RepID=UPI003558A6B1
MPRQPITVGKPFEQTVPFSLGVVTSGRLLFTAGITARDPDGQIVGVGDMSAQVQQCFDNLKDILDSVGADFGQVVRYMIYTTDMKAFNEGTRSIRWPYFVGRPCSTLIAVPELMLPEMMVEIEAIVALDD